MNIIIIIIIIIIMLVKADAASQPLHLTHKQLKMP